MVVWEQDSFVLLIAHMLLMVPLTYPLQLKDFFRKCLSQRTNMKEGVPRKLLDPKETHRWVTLNADEEENRNGIGNVEDLVL